MFATSSIVRPLAFVVSLAGVASAEPGTHAPAVSTWDTRASSVALGFQPGFFDGGHLDFASYYANFTATNGNLSSQFGIHYVNLRQSQFETVMHGGTASAVAVFSIPLAIRYESGVPQLALSPYVGVAPTFLINGSQSFIEIPLVLGAGLSWSPARRVTATPWFEFSPGVSLDTIVHPATINVAEAGVVVTNGKVHLTEADVRRLISQSVTFHDFFAVGFRAGIDVAFRLSNSVDFVASGTAGTLSTAFRGRFVGWVGANLVFRWDNVVPTVLPADARLEREACSDVEGRWLSCQAERTPPRKWPLVLEPTPPVEPRPVSPEAPQPPIKKTTATSAFPDPVIATEADAPVQRKPPPSPTPPLPRQRDVTPKAPLPPNAPHSPGETSSSEGATR